jgi:hypothetical protein
LSEKSCVSIIRLNFANTSASVMATVMGRVRDRVLQCSFKWQ